MSEPPRHLVRTRALSAKDAVRIRHPLNANADLLMHPLSVLAGMQRVHLNLARLAPGRESFVPHAHGVQEEFLFILEGEGTAQIGETQVAVGPGDYLGFPTDGTPHHLINTGAVDLVYLMGGERTAIEVSRFPTLGKILVMEGDTILVFDESDAERRTVADWIAGEE